MKPFFSNKGLNRSNMMLVKNNEIVREKEIIANIMNNYFTNITTHLKLKPTKIDPKANLESIIDTFQNHESVQRIKLANFHSKSSLKFNRKLLTCQHTASFIKSTWKDLCKQIDSFMKNKFSLYLCRFIKNHNTQNSFLEMIENWKKQLENGEKVEIIFMDFSKAFDTINHSLLLAKQKAYGFSNKALS